MKQKAKFIFASGFVSVLLLVIASSTSVVLGHPPDDDGAVHEHSMLNGGERYDPSAALIALDATLSGVVSSGPNAKVTKNLAASGRGERNETGATTDVWALGNYAYTGTFNNPCGGQPNAGGAKAAFQKRRGPRSQRSPRSPLGGAKAAFQKKPGSDSPTRAGSPSRPNNPPGYAVSTGMLRTSGFTCSGFGIVTMRTPFLQTAFTSPSTV